MKNHPLSNLYEYIYGIFEPFEASFLCGTYNVHINTKVYSLDSHEIAILNNQSFQLFTELLPFLNYIQSQHDFLENSIPNDHLTILNYDYYQKKLKSFSTDELMRKKITHLTKHHYQCLIIKIQHNFSGDPFDYLKKKRDENGVKKALDIFLRVIKEFQDYHILTEAPYVYLSDIHFRKTDGIFSYCIDEKGEVFTKIRPLLDLWTPKKTADAKEKATLYFNHGNQYNISDMLMARARVYVEQKSYSLAILHAIMSLEIVIPEVIELFLKQKTINQNSVYDLNKYSDLSIRLKVFLKIIFPSMFHDTIDKVSVAVTFRNKIMHAGFKESDLNNAETVDLINHCYVLKKILDKYIEEVH
ncbi:hypothetical protein [uncultured Sulfuricurvum sp.]|uniref:hypothetical protein n=1 Tax=uncultured Sulfuricurvum sp. TaxID=430693 RepID=UPI002636F583|nr:hypothetical protein [uncultured Sulfuricurvum sp.]